MKYSRILAACCSLAASLAAAETHLIVISIDGLRPAIYLQPEKENVKVPNLLALRDRGVSAERMVGIFPTVTYPSHTTLMTGTRSATHKIATNFVRGTANWDLNAADIKSETLWQAYRKAGFSTAIVTWPVTYGAVVDWLIPENLTLNMANAVDIIKKDATPKLFDELEERIGHLAVPSFDKADAFERLDEMTAAYAALIIRQHRPNFIAMHFLDADHKQHAFSPHATQAQQAFEHIDLHIGAIIKAVTDAGITAETNIVIVGDHGFAPVNTGINLTQVLADIGYAKIVDQKIITKTIDLMSSGGSAAFYAKPGTSTRDLERFNDKLKLEIAQHYQGILAYLPQPKLKQLGAYPDAIAAVTASAGYLLIEAAELRRTYPMPSLGGHGYDPDMPEMATGFIAAGPAFREHFRVPLMRMLDVAPTLAAINKVPLPQAEGVVIENILRAH